MTSHVEVKTIYGETFIMHRNNIKVITLNDTPEHFKDDWKKPQVCIITSYELNKEGNPLQLMVANSYSSLKKLLTDG